MERNSYLLSQMWRCCRLKTQETYSKLYDAIVEFYKDGYALIDVIDLATDLNRKGRRKIR